MNYYDTFDENGIFQCSVDEDDVHYKGLWHKVIRVWLYDSDGNIYLRVRKSDKKLDCINELHLLSSESAVECFDRGMFEKLGVHFPATSHIEQANIRKKQYKKTYLDNTEIRDNYFLCDFIGEFEGNTSYYLYSDDTDGLVKVNAKGVLNFLNTRTGEIIAYDVKPFGDMQNSRRFLKIDDIFNDRKEDLFIKYNFVINAIMRNAAQKERSKKEDERIKQLISRSQEFKEQTYKSHADDNEGDSVY
ncbi:MAG: hypothetical protein IJX17_08095 [Clostridia bacterium]|nr:hypothetical protein [Clostridia bacterium]